MTFPRCHRSKCAGRYRRVQQMPDWLQGCDIANIEVKVPRAANRYQHITASAAAAANECHVPATAMCQKQAAPTEGAHGMRSRFLPIDQLDEQTYAPRTVQVAGVLPELTVKDILAVGCTPAPGVGMWQYDFSDPDGPQVHCLRRSSVTCHGRASCRRNIKSTTAK